MNKGKEQAINIRDRSKHGVSSSILYYITPSFGMPASFSLYIKVHILFISYERLFLFIWYKLSAESSTNICTLIWNFSKAKKKMNLPNFPN